MAYLLPFSPLVFVYFCVKMFSQSSDYVYQKPQLPLKGSV